MNDHVNWMAQIGFPLGLAQDVGQLAASLLEHLTGRPTNAEVIAEAVLEGVSRLSDVGDRFAEADLIRAKAEFISARAQLVNAKARLLEAQAALISATHGQSTHSDHLHNESAVERVVDELNSLRAHLANFDALIGAPLAQISAPAA